MRKQGQGDTEKEQVGEGKTDQEHDGKGKTEKQQGKSGKTKKELGRNGKTEERQGGKSGSFQEVPNKQPLKGMYNLISFIYLKKNIVIVV